MLLVKLIGHAFLIVNQMGISGDYARLVVLGADRSLLCFAPIAKSVKP
jgi:hypothetical protein